MLTDKEQEEIRRKLLGLEEEPPANAWHKIAEEIHPPRRPRPIWWMLAAALLFIVGSAGVLYFISERPETETIAVDSTVEQVQENAVETIAGKSKSVEAESLAKTAITSADPATTNTQGTAADGTKGQEHQIINPHNTTTRPEGVALPEPKQKPEPNQKTRWRLPVVAGADKPKDKYKPVTETIAAHTSAAQLVPVAATITEMEDATTTDLLTGVEPQLRSSGAFTVPDSVSIALAPDSTLKASAPPESTDTSKNREWYLGLMFTPRYAFRAFTPAATDEIYITRLNNYKKLDPKRMGYEFGLHVGRKVKEQLYLDAGISVMQLQENVSYKYTTGKVDTLLKTRTGDGSYRAVPIYVEGERQLESTYTYGSVRVGATYYFLQSSRSRLNVTLAGGANLLAKGRTKEFINGELKETIVFPSEENLLEQTNYNLLLGVGYNLYLANDFELMFMPNLNYFLGSTFSKREPFGLKPYSLGISIQVRKRFIR